MSLIASAALARDDEGRASSLPDLTAFALMRTGGGAARIVGVDEAADALKDDDVVFVGELHDHIGNHLAEMALFRALQARAPTLALSMEQFERDVQPVVDDYLAGRVGEDALRKRGRAWSNYAEAYRPLVEYAKDHGLPVIAAEAPTSVVVCVGEKGPEFLSQLAPDKRGWAAADLHLGDGAYKDKFFRFLAEDGAHGDADGKRAQPSAAAQRSYAAQVTRDDTMAESIFLYVQKHPGRKVFHITGAYHVEGGLGTVERLKARAPGLKVAVVVPVEIEQADALKIGPGDADGADFAILLRERPKDYVTDAERKAAEESQAADFRVHSRCAL
jgi:uncharacterized iron-regulated protein